MSTLAELGKPVEPQDLFYTGFPSEPWVCDHQTASEVLREIHRLSNESTKRQATAFVEDVETARGLLWNLPGGAIINLLLNIEKDQPGTMLFMARTDAEGFADPLDVPGGDQDAWRRYVERVRFAAAILARQAIFHPTTLRRLVEIIRYAQTSRATD